MQTLDYIVLLIYLAGIFLVGVIFSFRNKSEEDLFTAGGQSPWWAAGLSSFMTMFSAGTFVVWGGIAYRLGLVAVAINLCYGVAALGVGYFVAGRWKQIGVATPAEYVRLRFGEAAVHFYTWAMTVFGIVGVGVAFYSLGVILVTMMPLAEGNPFRDPATGNLSLLWAVLLFGGVVVLYTMIGGLWAVLMTDVLQFIVLNLAVLFVIPLLLLRVGGMGDFLAQAPEDFFTPTSARYSWLFLAGWTAIHFFKVGAGWAFAQRFICVSSPRAARRSSYLFGILYLVSPLLWLLPPLLWRIEQPIPADASEADIVALAEQAYIQSCSAVLPAGMVGLLVAAMFSATASMASSQLNVFAGVLTHDMYRPLVGARATRRHLLWAGRLLTLALGVVLLGVSLLVPRLGGAERVVIAVASLVSVPLMAPTLIGLFSPRLDARAVWYTAAVCGTLGILVKFGLNADGWLAGVQSLAGLRQWIEVNSSNVDILLGVVLPLLILGLLHFSRSDTSRGWLRVQDAVPPPPPTDGPVAAVSKTPALTVAAAIGGCGLLMAVLAAVNQQGRAALIIFAAALFVLAAVILALTLRLARVVEPVPTGR